MIRSEDEVMRFFFPGKHLIMQMHVGLFLLQFLVPRGGSFSHERLWCGTFTHCNFEVVTSVAP